VKNRKKDSPKVQRTQIQHDWLTRFSLTPCNPMGKRKTGSILLQTQKKTKNKKQKK
jgi:hypothetical protein